MIFFYVTGKTGNVDFLSCNVTCISSGACIQENSCTGMNLAVWAPPLPLMPSHFLL